MTARAWLAAATLAAALAMAGGVTAQTSPATPAASPSAPPPVPAPMPERERPANPKADRVTIADAFIELRTGPGRGYPVFFVAARGEQIDVELRHTDWFRVRTAGDKVGWVHRRQLESTLTAAGEQKRFRDILVDDYLSRKVQLGGAYGRFKSEPMLKVHGSYRLSETLHLEGTLGQVQGVFSGTDFWHLNIMAEPWSDKRFSPFVGIGVGRFRNFPNLSLVGADTTSANLANAAIGVRYYLTDRFVLRADYSLYTVFVDDSRTTEYRAWTAGVSFFF